MNTDEYRNSVQRYNDYSAVFADDMGQRVLDDILAYCHILEPMPNANPNESLVREARRDVANMMLSAMNFNPEKHRRLFEHERRR